MAKLIFMTANVFAIPAYLLCVCIEAAATWAGDLINVGMCHLGEWANRE